MPTRAGRAALSLILEIVGFAGVTIGAFMLATWLGFLLAGLALLAVGILVEPTRHRRPPQ